MMYRFLTIVFLLAASCLSSNAQLNISSNQSAVQLVQRLLGAGISVSNETLTCDSSQASGFFTSVGTILGLDSGIILTSGSCITTGSLIGVSGPASNNCDNATLPDYSDSDLASLVNTTPSDIRDACKLEFDFVPNGDTVKFRYVFGSDEYPTYNCSNFNDVFGFFISGPGITGNQNIALVPGTSIPVAINSVNNGVAGNLGPCTAMGPGSPFTALYIDNSAGTQIAYNGFTHVFTAIATTVPCSTYHIKLAIADKADQILDSGVFIEAGSLVSNGVSISNSTPSFTKPQSYIVEGCMPINIKFALDQPKNYPVDFNLVWSGSATNGVDYPLQSSTKTIPPNVTLDSIYFTPVNDFITEGLETITLHIYNNSTCSNSLIDSVTYTINDSIILNYSPISDTICLGDTVQLTSGSDTSITLAWSPGATLTDANADTTYAFPQVSTVYTLLASYQSCPLQSIQIPIEVINNLQVDAGENDTICTGVPYNLEANPSPINFIYTYEWTPSTALNDPTLRSPTFSPTALGTQRFVVKASTDTNCYVTDTVDILVIEDDFNILNEDTSICQGQSVQLGITGSPFWEYKWSPPLYLSDTTILNPISTPDTSILYIAQGSYPGCLTTYHAFSIDVQPNPVVEIGGDTAICDYQSLYIESDVSPSGYPYYTYEWTPANLLIPSNQDATTFIEGGMTSNISLTVSTPVGCTGTDDRLITVNPGDFLSFTEKDSGFCVPVDLQFGLTGASTYQWSPTVYLSDSTIGDPIISPKSGIAYTIIGTSAENCLDTAYISIEPYAGAVLELGEDREYFDGDQLQLYAAGNCTEFQWSPSTYLDYSDVSNPIVSGMNQSQEYIVKGKTIAGCETLDTLSVLYNDGIVIELPNAFNPNEGPVKIIKKGNWELDNFAIYNRWGEKVFNTQSVEEGWDGKYKNEVQGIGNFVYVIEAHKPDGQKLNKNGNILLIK